MRTAIIISSIIIITVITAVIIRFTIARKNPEKKDFAKENYEIQRITGDIKIRHVWDVPEILKEISAISYIDEHRFACIQDELGKIFIYNTDTGKIEKEITFGESGDYEGLALNENTAYVLRADGQIFEISNYMFDNRTTKEHQTPLTKKQDTEGLAFDKENNRLLVAIKESDPDSESYKGIYEFDLNTYKMKTQPVLKIDLDNPAFDGIKSGKKSDSKMQPSEIGIHPQTGNIYITDGAKPKLLIMDKSGKIISLAELKDKEFSQPEGLTFSPEGRLFISNEGSKKPGNILEIDGSR